MSYEGEEDTDVKIANLLKVTGLINTTLKRSEIQKHARIKLCITLALPIYVGVKTGQ
jgi:hypothetical protein